MKLNRWPLVFAGLFVSRSGIRRNSGTLAAAGTFASSATVIAGLFVFLAPALRAGEGTAVKIVVKEDTIDFLAGNDLVGTYNKGPNVAKPYMWPLYGPGGAQMTRTEPADQRKTGDSDDHPHQKSVWFCHGDVIPEGIEIKESLGVNGADFWSEGRNSGRMICTKVGEPLFRGSNHGQITTWNEWKTRDGLRILEEARTIHLYLLGDARLLVFDIDLAAVVPVTFGDTKEGSFGVRVNDDIRETLEWRNKQTRKVERKKGPGKLENAEGQVGGAAVWGRISKWCDYSGPLQGKVVGVAVFDDPSNPYPACWHSRAYGLLAANPFGRGGKHSGFPDMKGRTDLVKLGKGEHLKLRYGILLHAGDAKEGRVAERYQEFVKLK
jgi:hypothetical protein